MFTLNCRGRLLAARGPLVMGIINVTPDSFYEQSRRSDAEGVIALAERMLNEGADIIDIGAQSTRPGASLLSAQEELDRMAGLIEVLTEKFPSAFFSIDTFHAQVAEACVAAGASIVNDISGGEMDSRMLNAVASMHVPYVCMHMRGTPQTMQQHTHYEHVTREVLDYFIRKTEDCRRAGIADVIIDPGFGFSKTIEQNFSLLKDLRALKMTGAPLMAGLSRKSTIYKTLGIPAAEALNGSTVLNTVALMNGADILRVHDVKEAVECVRLVTALRDA